MLFNSTRGHFLFSLRQFATSTQLTTQHITPSSPNIPLKNVQNLFKSPSCSITSSIFPPSPSPQTNQSCSFSCTPIVQKQRNIGNWKWPTTNNRDNRAKMGNRVWYPSVTNNQEAKNLVLNLDPTGRKLVMLHLTEADEKNYEFPNKAEPVPMSEFYKVFLINCLPFIGFGFLDNAIMILAGEYIDVKLGMWLGISTMAAAALGNLVSDLAGVGTAGYIENVVEKVKSIQPNLKHAQFNYTSVRWATSAGRALGITIGCLLGMIPLLFFPAKERKCVGRSEK